MTTEHINTGCHYDSKGQEITIVFSGDKAEAFFVDHSRSISGLVKGAHLDTRRVITAYVNDLYTDEGEPAWLGRSQCDVMNERQTYTFTDWADNYRTWIMHR